MKNKRIVASVLVFVLAVGFLPAAADAAMADPRGNDLIIKNEVQADENNQDALDDTYVYELSLQEEVCKMAGKVIFRNETTTAYRPQTAGLEFWSGGAIHDTIDVNTSDTGETEFDYETKQFPKYIKENANYLGVNTRENDYVGYRISFEDNNIIFTYCEVKVTVVYRNANTKNEIQPSTQYTVPFGGDLQVSALNISGYMLDPQCSRKVLLSYITYDITHYFDYKKTVSKSTPNMGIQSVEDNSGNADKVTIGQHRKVSMRGGLQVGASYTAYNIPQCAMDLLTDAGVKIAKTGDGVYQIKLKKDEEFKLEFLPRNIIFNVELKGVEKGGSIAKLKADKVDVAVSGITEFAVNTMSAEGKIYGRGEATAAFRYTATGKKTEETPATTDPAQEEIEETKKNTNSEDKQPATNDITNASIPLAIMLIAGMVVLVSYKRKKITKE